MRRRRRRGRSEPEPVSSGFGPSSSSTQAGHSAAGPSPSFCACRRSDREIADSVYPFFGIAGFPNQQQILGNGRRWEMLRRHNHSRMRSAFEELRELHRHGALVVSDKDPSIASGCFENVGILEAPQAGVRRSPKLNRWLETKNSSENDMVQVLVRLKPDSQVRFAFCSRASASFW